jgi:hypothetical protein
MKSPARSVPLGLRTAGALGLAGAVAVALLVSLWVLPGLVAALTPIRARDMLRESQAALITAFIAGDLFIVLPSLMQASQTLLARINPDEREPGRLPQVIVPASFNFPHTGKLLSLSFVLFAGWFAETEPARRAGISRSHAEVDGSRLTDEEVLSFLRLLLPAGATTDASVDALFAEVRRIDVKTLGFEHQFD